MELRRFLSVAAATAVVGTAVLMTGCGDDSSSTSGLGGTSSIAVQAGFWKGMPVNNSRHQRGHTNGTGQFKYKDGDNVTWDNGLGDIVLGNITNTSLLTQGMIAGGGYAYSDGTDVNTSTQKTLSYITSALADNSSIENASIGGNQEFVVGPFITGLNKAMAENSSIAFSNSSFVHSVAVLGVIPDGAAGQIYDNVKAVAGSAVKIANASAMQALVNNVSFRNAVDAAVASAATAAAEELPNVAVTNETKMMLATSMSDAMARNMYKSVNGQVVTDNSNAKWILSGAYAYGQQAEGLTSPYNGSIYNIVGLPGMLTGWTQNTNKTLVVNGTTYVMNMTDNTSGSESGTVSGGGMTNFQFTSDGYAVNLINTTSGTGKAVAVEKDSNNTGFYAYLMRNVVNSVLDFFTYENRTATNSTAGTTNMTRHSGATFE